MRAREEAATAAASLALRFLPEARWPVKTPNAPRHACAFALIASPFIGTLLNRTSFHFERVSQLRIPEIYRHCRFRCRCSPRVRAVRTFTTPCAAIKCREASKQSVIYGQLGIQT